MHMAHRSEQVLKVACGCGLRCLCGRVGAGRVIPRQDGQPRDFSYLVLWCIDVKVEKCRGFRHMLSGPFGDDVQLFMYV